MANFDGFDPEKNDVPESNNYNGFNEDRRPYFAYQPTTPGSVVPPEPPHKKRRFSARIVALCLVCALLGGFGGGAAMYYLGETVTAQHVVITPPPTVNATKASSSDVLTPSQIYSNNVISCVSINGTVTQSYYNRPMTSTVSGSGFIIAENGYIITNYHVVADASQDSITVTLYNQNSYPATLVGYDEGNDIAVLKINVTGLTPITFGSSSSLSVGDSVYTIGDPLGTLCYTMTSGIVSALDRMISTENSDYISTFQTDAAVNSGNSGGPIINSRGQVVGIVTAKYSDAGVEGLGFAIPIDNVLYMINDIMEFGYVKNKPMIGITVTDANKDKNGSAGAYVQTVNSGSAADKAGIKSGDVIVQMGDRTIMSRQDLFSQRLKYKAGDTVKLKVYRSGSYVEMSLTFDQSPQKS